MLILFLMLWGPGYQVTSVTLALSKPMLTTKHGAIQTALVSAAIVSAAGAEAHLVWCCNKAEEGFLCPSLPSHPLTVSPGAGSTHSNQHAKI